MKNFLSIGAVSQSIDLGHAGLTLVLGENLDIEGSGNKNGTGKCLRGATQVDIAIHDPITQAKFIEFMKKRQ
jgi:hypothetical protein